MLFFWVGLDEGGFWGSKLERGGWEKGLIGDEVCDGNGGDGGSSGGGQGGGTGRTAKRPAGRMRPALALWCMCGDERSITLEIIALGVFSPLFPLLFAMIAVFVQAIRYVYAVVYRIATDFVVAPVEVVGMVFNIYLLIEVCMSSTCNPCHRPFGDVHKPRER